MATFCANCKDPYIVGGDFNILRFLSDKNKSCSMNRFSYLFNIIININGLGELDTSGGGGFTWSNNQKDPTLKELDRVLMSRDLELLFPTIVSWLNPREISGHSPIIISTSSSTQVGNRDFKFELFWLKHLDFYPNIERI
jgi:hypothetical protein